MSKSPRPILRVEPGTINEGLLAGADEMLALHWEEVGPLQNLSPFDPNWSVFRDLERRGTLKTFLLWKGSELIGYSVWVVQPTWHSQHTRWAICDLLYVDPEHRKGWAGVKLIRESERHLKALGTRVIMFTVSPWRSPEDLDYKRGRDSFGRLLEKLGYRLIEESWAKSV